MTTTRQLTVPADETITPFFSLDPGTSLITQVGEVRHRDYDGRKARVLFYTPILGTDREEFALGQGLSGTSILSFSEVFKVLLNRGYVPDLITPYRGGARMFVVFNSPNIQFRDTLLVPESSKKATGEILSLSIGFTGDLRKNKPYTLTAGFFRSVCANGLILKTLDLGTIKIIPGKFHALQVEQFINEVESLARKIPFVRDLRVYNHRAFNWGIKTLQAIEKDPAYFYTLPSFAQQPLNQILSLPDWFRDSLVEGFFQFHFNQSNATTLLLSNMVTQCISDNREEHPAAPRFYFSLDTLVNHLETLLIIGSFKGNLTTETVPVLFESL